MSTTETDPGLLAWLQEAPTIEAREAAERFIEADAAAKAAKAEHEAARDLVIVTFAAVEVDRFAGVLVSPTKTRTFDHAAAARLDVANLTTPQTSADRVDACLKAGTLTRRQYSRIVTETPGHRVQVSQS